MHLDGGYTRVSVVRTEGLGLANGGAEWDIPTQSIPLHLRGIGSQFLAVTPRFTPEAHDSADDIRRIRDQIEIHELTGDESLSEDQV
jgi:hypothetical protein